MDWEGCSKKEEHSVLTGLCIVLQWLSVREFLVMLWTKLYKFTVEIECSSYMVIWERTNFFSNSGWIQASALVPCRKSIHFYLVRN